MSSSTSLQVGLGASQADIDVQGEIDFDFFEDEAIASASPLPQKGDEASGEEHSVSSTEELNSDDNIPTVSEESLKNSTGLSVRDSDLSTNIKKPIITISCDNDTGVVQKTTIEAVIPSPFDYKDNKCGKMPPSVTRMDKRVLSPRMKSKIFDDKDFSDDSSLSSMSPSESDLSSVSGESDNNADGTDSMTDVSPLCSPFQCRTPVPNSQVDVSSANMMSVANNGKLQKRDGVKFSDDVKDDRFNKCDTVDLHELLKAVKRLEIEQNTKALKCEDKCSNVSVLTHNGKCKKNLSFSNDEVRRIDNENQRLLKRIVAHQGRPKSRPSSSAANLPSSAINRQRQQRQIELENLALLRRLESTKPSRDVSRFHLLRDYDRRSSATSSRASSRSCCSVSHPSSCRSSAQSSGRSSTLSLKSGGGAVTRSQMTTPSSINKPKRNQMLIAARD